ncbi:hypothetical protein LIA77_07398 [Sarocladium implicatum]|nr:hypothetical protein LIA77_07398 [Sarocladium implicatum]
MVAKGTTQKAYHIPIRGKAPSPGSSPDSRSRSPLMSTIVRTTTPDSLGETEDTGLVTIGMALGSPSHPPNSAVPAWRPQPVARAMTASAAVEQPASQTPREEEPPKSKSRKWGIFGRSKSTKRGRSATGSAPTPPSSTTERFSPPQASFTRQGQASPQAVGSPAMRKSGVARSQTAPLLGETPIPRRVPAVSPSYQTIQSARKPLPAHPLVSEDRPPPPAKAPGTVPKKQLLNVDIPSIEMERYSIMFGSVLQPNRGSSSLLARRQATLEKLRMLKDETEREEEDLPLKPPPRRASSPNPRQQSPSFSLFPSTPAKATPSHVPSPRNRSFTSPAFLPSPSQPNFSPQEAEIYLQRSVTPSDEAKRKRPGRQQASPLGSSQRESSRERARLQKPRSSSKLRTPQIMVESPVSVSGSPGASRFENKTLQSVDEDEPAWEIVSKVSHAQSAGVSRDQGASTTPRSVASAPVQDPKNKAEDEAQRALRDAVENSIRRQISMSQQQRQMLRPQHLKASPLATSHSSRKDASPQGVGIAKNVVSRAVVAGNERLAETKTSTPLLVHPGGEGHSPLTNRKSERIIFDSA